MRIFDELNMKKFNPQIIFFILSSLTLASCRTKPTDFVSLSGEFLPLNNSPTVLVFLNVECPICQKYQGEYSQIMKRHPESYFAFVLCGQQDLQAVKSFLAYDSIPLKLAYLDKDFRMAKTFKAKITPQAVIIKDHQTVYSGKLDDRFENLGSSKASASINYVDNALFSLAKNEKVKISHTEAVGCFIEPK
jgi:hypothetical protein